MTKGDKPAKGKRKQQQSQARVRAFVLDSQALSLVVGGNRELHALLSLAAAGHADVVTSPMTLIEAYDGKIPEARWNWVLSQMTVANVGEKEAKEARALLAEAGLHGHKYAIDAVLSVVACQQPGDVTVFTSDVDDMEKLLPPTVLVKKV
ncbi:hypothetical protein ACFVWX_00825 [Streptomyces sp. NPDC058220]|uniref:hypothetical protein n=1 Tax=unclassified Streptomyces TaxID=2593676 RepID=UPI0036E3F3D4